MYTLYNGSLCRPLCKETLLSLHLLCLLSLPVISKWPMAHLQLCANNNRPSPLTSPWRRLWLWCNCNCGCNCHYDLHADGNGNGIWMENNVQLVTCIVITTRLVKRLLQQQRLRRHTMVHVTLTLMAIVASCRVAWNYDSRWCLMIGMDYSMPNEPEQLSAINSRQRTINADSWIHLLLPLLCLYGWLNHLLTCITWEFIFIDNIHCDQCDHCHRDLLLASSHTHGICNTYFIWYS